MEQEDPIDRFDLQIKAYNKHISDPRNFDPTSEADKMCFYNGFDDVRDHTKDEEYQIISKRVQEMKTPKTMTRAEKKKQRKMLKKLSSS
jgi:hypothetical protein